MNGKGIYCTIISDNFVRDFVYRVYLVRLVKMVLMERLEIL